MIAATFSRDVPRTSAISATVSIHSSVIQRECHDFTNGGRENKRVWITISERPVASHDGMRKGKVMSSILSFLRRRLLASRTIVGFVLVVASVIGVVSVVRLSTPGERVVMASSFLSAGTVITADVIDEVRVTSLTTSPGVSLTGVVGRVVGSDIGVGEIITPRLLEPTTLSRVQISVPIGVMPPSAMTNGASVDLWAIDQDGAAPPTTVALNATVVTVEDSGFGGDVVMTVLVDSLEVDRVLAVLGSSYVIVATSGETP